MTQSIDYLVIKFSLSARFFFVFFFFFVYSVVMSETLTFLYDEMYVIFGFELYKRINVY